MLTDDQGVLQVFARSRQSASSRPLLQVIRHGLVMYEGSDPARIEAIIRPGDTLSNGRNSLVYQGPAPEPAETFEAWKCAIAIGRCASVKGIPFAGLTIGINVLCH